MYISYRSQFTVFKMRSPMLIFFVLIAAVLSQEEADKFRLPNNMKPLSYRLDIITHLNEGNFRFEGAVEIKITCIESTNTIILHSANLTIDNTGVVITNGGDKAYQVNSVTLDPSKEFMYVQSSEKFKAGDDYILTIPFSGNLTDSLVGYYKSSYVDRETNKTKWIAVTQFEPADARRAFPCFDEPALKATFKIRLGHHKDFSSASNMPLKESTAFLSYPDYVLDEFEDSVPMSTYLVAYMVTDFIYIDGVSDEGDSVKFRIVARKDAADQTDLAKTAGPLVLKYYEEYFDEKFPLAKQDMVAIPDFNAGAMENWGLITYRETALLLNPKLATIGNVHRVASVVAHELAHQWFGNLVTMKWWTDLWLNEGFATYVAARGVDYLYPEWNCFQVETAENFLEVLDRDSLNSSHPVSVPIGHPDEISQIFDAISYQKGSFLLHMMNTFLGEESFKTGIRNYINKNKYSNAEQDDLWNSMTEVAHADGSLPNNITVKKIMDTWTLQTGYPVLRVVRDYNSNAAILSQERFLSSKSSENQKSCWWIPLTLTTSSNPDFSQTKANSWLNCNEKTQSISLAKEDKWVIFNLQMAGLYRVAYDIRNWMEIIATLNDPQDFQKIHVLNRVQLIDDALSFCKKGELDYGVTFQLLKYLRHETEYLPWMAALNGLAPINKLMRRTPNQGIYQSYMQRMISPVYSRFRDMSEELKGYEPVLFKNHVISEACRNRMKDCSDQALSLFRKWMELRDLNDEDSTNNIIPKELKTNIYCQAVKYGSMEEWDFLWERYLRSNVATEKAKLLSALGCSSETWLLNRYLNWTIGENSIIRKQDAITVFSSVASGDVGFYVAKDFLYRRIDDIYKYFQPRGDRIGKYVSIIGSQMKTKEELIEIQNFVNNNKFYLREADILIKQTIETVSANANWTDTFYNKIISHLVTF
ncbi:aminopeptidase N-like [Daktulosphaira vitifoliae]|uniref:aminopeptidase N-like n=1 Tax=Daktulosphaira vitifoliae TaxID=58002 RepID=UPI0021A9F66F|nr:aminopeptidase N-like [Daktulosphaira vitifoliae]